MLPLKPTKGLTCVLRQDQNRGSPDLMSSGSSSSVGNKGQENQFLRIFDQRNGYIT